MNSDIAEMVRGKCRVIAVNNTGIRFKNDVGIEYRALAPWADVLYAADRLWWYHNLEEASRFDGYKLSIAEIINCSGELPLFPEMLLLGNGGVYGYDDRQDHIRSGRNSGFQAVQVAGHFGAKRILLCGFDMHGNGGQHYFGDHVHRKGHEARFDWFLETFYSSVEAFEARGIEIINCTEGSALKCFPFMRLKDALGLPNLREGSQLHSKQSYAARSGEVRTDNKGREG